MRDTKEYFETVGRLDGVILLNWTEKTLQTQVDAIVKTSNQLERAVHCTVHIQILQGVPINMGIK